ncbi:MAG TPA: hypothetical protein VIV60_26780 [Polyangiaceae bacterium]
MISDIDRLRREASVDYLREASEPLWGELEDLIARAREKAAELHAVWAHTVDCSESLKRAGIDVPEATPLALVHQISTYVLAYAEKHPEASQSLLTLLVRHAQCSTLYPNAMIVSCPAIDVVHHVAKQARASDVERLDQLRRLFDARQPHDVLNETNERVQ